MTSFKLSFHDTGPPDSEEQRVQALMQIVDEVATEVTHQSTLRVVHIDFESNHSLHELERIFESEFGFEDGSLKLIEERTIRRGRLHHGNARNGLVAAE